MAYTLELDFNRDFDTILISELATHGMVVDPSEPSDTIRRKYFNYKKRAVEPVPRTVHISNEFTCPAVHQAALDTIKETLGRGDEITAYLSARLHNLDYSDPMLNDWGIHHLHLGTTVRADGFMQRTGPLLFVRFDKKNAYLINVYAHGAWTKKDILLILHRNWPDTIADYRLRGIEGIEHDASEGEIGQLRGMGVNTLVQVEPGAVYTSIGGGVTTARTSTDVTRLVMEYSRRIAEFEEIARKNAELIGDDASSASGQTIDPLRLELLIEDHTYYIRELSTDYCYKLGQLGG